MYPWNEDISKHANSFINVLAIAIEAARENIKKESFFSNQLHSQMSYVNLFNNWEIKKKHWEAFLTSFKDEPTEIRNQFKSFRYEA